MNILSTADNNIRIGSVYYRPNSIFLPAGIYGVNLTPAARSIVFAAIVESVSEYLSLRYIISVIPDWIIAFVHSLHGNRVVYIFELRISVPV